MVRGKKKVIILIIIICITIASIILGLTFYIAKRINREDKTLNNSDDNFSATIKQYDITQFDSFIDNDRYIPVLHNNRYGFINEKGEEKINCEYERVSVFYKISLKNKDYQVALIKKDEKYGLITKDNQNMFFDQDLNEELNQLYNRIANTRLNENTVPIEEFSSMMMFIMEACNYDYESERVSNSRNEQIEIELEQDENNNYLYNDSNYSIKIEENDINNEYNWDQYIPTTVSIIKNDEEKSSKEYIPFHNATSPYITLYDDGYIPFCNLDELIQGWYDKEGNRKGFKGKFEILNIRKDILILKNYDNENDMNNIIFIDSNNNILLQAKEVEILDNGYLIKNDNEKIIKIDDNLEIISKEYDKIIYSVQLELSNKLTSLGIYYSGIYEEE